MKRWTDQEDTLLRELLARGSSSQYIAEQLNRTDAMVRSRARRLGLTVGQTSPTSEEPPPEPIDPVHPDLRRLERTVQGLRDDNRDLRAKLRAEEREGGVIEELTGVLRDTLEPIPVSPGDFPSLPATGDRFPVDMVVKFSDQHADRVIHEEGTWGLERYDFNVFRCRLWEYTKNIERYTQLHLPRFDFETLWVFHLGDSVNGDIHDMKLRNQFANSMKAAVAVGEVQAQALAYLAPKFKRIAVVCVPGNHGRTTKQIEWVDPHDSFDWLTATTMQLRLADMPNIDIFTPRAWSAHVSVRGWLWHLNHGHGVVGTWGIPWYGFERREGRVQRLLSMVDRQADYFAYGHFHTPMTRPAGKGKAVHAGPWYMTDEYSLNKLSVGNEPEQQMIVVSERFGRQMEIPVMLRDREREAALHAGEYEPPFQTNIVLDSSVAPSQGMGELVIT